LRSIAVPCRLMDDLKLAPKRSTAVDAGLVRQGAACVHAKER
jgi:hypothetical protein